MKQMKCNGCGEEKEDVALEHVIHRDLEELQPVIIWRQKSHILEPYPLPLCYDCAIEGLKKLMQDFMP